MSLGSRIKQARIDRGLTQAQLGKIVGKAESTVRTWELDRAQVTQVLVSKGSTVDTGAPLVVVG